MRVKINLTDLKKNIDKMVDDHENRRNSMSNHAMIEVSGISDDEADLKITQFCEYAECNPHVRVVLGTKI